jgi:hypothetical protein
MERPPQARPTRKGRTGEWGEEGVRRKEVEVRREERITINRRKVERKETNE